MEKIQALFGGVFFQETPIVFRAISNTQIRCCGAEFFDLGNLIFHNANEKSTPISNYEILTAFVSVQCGGMASEVTCRFLPMSFRSYWRSFFTASQADMQNIV